MLNMVLTLEDGCLTWEADPRHLEVLVETLNLQGVRGLKLPGVMDGGEGSDKKAARCKKAQEPELDGREHNDLDDGDGHDDHDGDVGAFHDGDAVVV